MSGTDYPDGDGAPNCPHCKGRGVIPIPIEKRHPMAIGPQTQICPCVHKRDLLANMERGWRGLSTGNLEKNSPLIGLEDSDLWITARDKILRNHLKAMVAKHTSRWYFAVVTDTDLMDAWLHHVSDYEVLDADVRGQRRGRPTDKYTALVDLTEPPDLLILRLGVKAARNSAMPEVLLEALQHRGHLGKPTWIVDHPDQPLAEKHISWSPQVRDFLSDWDYCVLPDDRADLLPTVEELCDGGMHQSAGPAPVVKETNSILERMQNAAEPVPKWKKGGLR